MNSKDHTTSISKKFVNSRIVENFKPSFVILKDGPLSRCNFYFFLAINCSPDTVIMKFSDPVLRRLTINMTNITKLTLEEKKKTYPVPPWTWGPSPRKKEFHLYLPKQVKSAGQRLMISLVVYPSLYLELKILHNQIHDKKSKKKTRKITFVSSNEDYESTRNLIICIHHKKS